jgi:hypothetical protein
MGSLRRIFHIKSGRDRTAGWAGTTLTWRRESFQNRALEDGFPSPPRLFGASRRWVWRYRDERADKRPFSPPRFSRQTWLYCEGVIALVPLVARRDRWDRCCSAAGTRPWTLNLALNICLCLHRFLWGDSGPACVKQRTVCSRRGRGFSTTGLDTPYSFTLGFGTALHLAAARSAGNNTPKRSMVPGIPFEGCSPVEGDLG